MPEWIPYETSDEPALEVSIDVDLDEDAAFRKSHPYAVTLAVSGFPVDAGGQPDDTTAETLFGLEQRADTICSGSDAALACTVSGDSKYLLIAYAASNALEAALREALTGHSFAMDVRSERDDAWAVYERYALRGDDLENARDADLILQMQEAGEDLSQEYAVTFEWSLQNKRSLDAALQALRNAEYDVPNELYDDIIPVTVEMFITEEDLQDARAAIAQVLAPYQARYEGWEFDALEDEELADEEPVET